MYCFTMNNDNTMRENSDNNNNEYKHNNKDINKCIIVMEVNNHLRAIKL